MMHFKVALESFYNSCDINSETKYFVDSLDKVSLTDLVGVKGYNINTTQQSLKWKNEGGDMIWKEVLIF